MNATFRASIVSSERFFTTHVPIDLVEKDFGYALESAQAVGAFLPATRAVHRIYAEARSKGHGGDNIAGVVQLFT